MNLTENQIRDYQKYYIERPTSEFSPEHNDFVVQNTIKKTNEMRMKKRKAYVEQVSERVDAAYNFMKFMAKGGNDPQNKYDGNMLAMKYFGKRELARLQGRKILKRIVDQQRKLFVIEEIY